MQDRSRSTTIHFGTSFLKHLIRIWNIRIIYPSQDIFIWDDDISGTYTIPKYNPSVAESFAYAIISYFSPSHSGIFGSNNIPSEYETLARARVFLAGHLSRDPSLVAKNAKILDLVEYEVEEDPSSVQYTPEVADDLHQGVYDPTLGRDMNTPHNQFSDNTLMADIRSHMLNAMTARIDALFITLSYDKLLHHQSIISMDTFAAFLCSWVKEHLCIIINTMYISVLLPDAKRLRILDIISCTWHEHIILFILLEGVTLLGNLEHAISVAP